ncbi:hypothetical protein HDU89_008151 [Geranomyces variabilis]|nr:hypothetical protein HDU89_008151 [Geranomyces variabilis]
MISSLLYSCLPTASNKLAAEHVGIPLEDPAIQAAQASTAKFALVIHGGAGVIDPEAMPPQTREKYAAALKEALAAGYDVLTEGGSSMDAVEAAVRAMEDCPLFNAGKGAVFSRDGKNVCEASIMDGRTAQAGAATLLTKVKNPISLARVVKEKAPHVFIASTEAEQFAAENGLDVVDEKYFFTEHRWRQHVGGAGKAAANLHSEPPAYQEKADAKYPDPYPQGTVGACAVDQNGDLAAATSTGGKNNKWTYRIGDTPLIGCGNYAENKYAAVSGTGDGEYFIRHAVAHDVVARIKYGGQSLVEASNATVHETLQNAGGAGGLVAVGPDGRVALPFNTSGMYRGFIKDNGVPYAAIFADEWF